MRISGHSSNPPTFENTFVALEKSGRLLRRARTVFGSLSSANTFRVHPLNPDLLLVSAEWLKPPQGVPIAKRQYAGRTLYTAAGFTQAGVYEARPPAGG